MTLIMTWCGLMQMKMLMLPEAKEMLPPETEVLPPETEVLPPKMEAKEMPLPEMEFNEYSFIIAKHLFADSCGTVKKRRFYPDDLKIAIYLKLLACTHPPVMHHGVSKAVALQFDVPVRVVQRVWREGQNGGIEGVKNKLNFNCGRKRIEIDPEAIKAVPLAQRTTFQDLANALGLISSKLNIVNQ
ncbi:Os04g0681850 [Oryza sativa Japonica Group]|uniref:Os04g0681850 protein n=1 Tax=Oryza sativa subsp. japonica TaxID=39947 RepID=A0A0P0WGG8_ORYSJ|nr:Os04g0681850 [Oryza sativa Japonica Group]